MEVKSDHPSKFSNLSNWKEEALKISGIVGAKRVLSNHNPIMHATRK